MDTVVIGICDDQEIAYSELVNIVKHYCIKRKIKFQILSFSNGEIIKKMQLVNILFLDTEMTCADQNYVKNKRIILLQNMSFKIVSNQCILI